MDGSTGSAGGGVVFIFGQVKITLKKGAVIKADGEKGILNQAELGGNSKAETKQGGSGSGGSIQIFTEKLEGDDDTWITANGGDNPTSGGEGGGGRLKVSLLNWHNESAYYTPGSEGFSLQGKHFKGNFRVLEGKPCQPAGFYCGVADPESNGKAGTISTTPCLPGYYSNFMENKVYLCAPC